MAAEHAYQNNHFSNQDLDLLPLDDATLLDLLGPCDSIPPELGDQLFTDIELPASPLELAGSSPLISPYQSPPLSPPPFYATGGSLSYQHQNENKQNFVARVKPEKMHKLASPYFKQSPETPIPQMYSLPLTDASSHSEGEDGCFSSPSPPQASHYPMVPSDSPLHPSSGSHSKTKKDKGPIDPSEEAVKRERRMMKNRESAALSRKKKKDYLSALEQKIHEQELVIKALQTENSALRSENQKLKEGSPHPVKPVVATFMVCLFCFGLFMNPLGQYDGGNALSSDVSPAMPRGRALMAVRPSEVSSSSSKLPSSASPSTNALAKSSSRELQEKKGRGKRGLSDNETAVVMASSSREPSVVTALVAKERVIQSLNATDFNATRISEVAFPSSRPEGPPIIRLSQADRMLLHNSFLRDLDYAFLLCSEVQLYAPAKHIGEKLAIVMPSAYPSDEHESEFWQFSADLRNATKISLSSPYEVPSDS